MNPLFTSRFKTFISIFFTVSILAGSMGARAQNTAIASGNWSATSTWSTGIVPVASDSVVIPAAYIVTIDGTTDVCNSIYIQGTLQYDATTTAKKLTATKNVNIASGGIFQSNPAAAGAVTHTLSLGGNLSDSGTLNCYAINTFSKITITFTGAQSNSFYTTPGSILNLFTVTLQKGTSNANILDFNPGAAFMVNGATTVGFLTITDGAFKVDGTTTFSNPVFTSATYNVPSAGEFWLDDPNATIVAQAGTATFGTAANNGGILRVTAGTYNVGAVAGNNLTATGQNTIEGGTVNVAGLFQVTTSGAKLTMSGGTLNLATIGNTSTTASLNVGSAVIFNMSGGTMNVATASSTLDFGIQSTHPANVTITGGNLFFGTVSGTLFHVLGSIPTASISVPNATLTMNSTTYAYGNITVPAGATFSLGNATLDLSDSLINNGTVTGGGTSSNLSFLSSVPQSLSGTGATSGYIATVIVNNSSGAIPAVSINEDMTVSTALTLTAGSVGGSGNITLGNAAASTTLTTTVSSGSLNYLANAPVFSLSGVTYNVTYSGASANIATGNELTSDSVYTLTINNATGVTLNAPVYIKTNLTLTSGILTTSATNLPTLAASVATPPSGSATSYVSGPLAINVNTSSNTFKRFAIGKPGAFRPLAITNFESNGTLQTYTAEAISGASGGTSVGGNLLDATRYYHLTNTANIFSTTTAGIALSIGADDGVAAATALVSQAAAANGAYISIGSKSNYGTNVADTSFSAVIQGDDYIILAGAGPCTAPTQPGPLTFSNITSSAVTVNFTPDATPPGSVTSGYIAVASTAPLSQMPVNGAVYATSAGLGNGTVVGTGTNTAVFINTVSTLASNTPYYITVFPYNYGPCSGPVYDTVAPQSATFTTSPCIPTFTGGCTNDHISSVSGAGGLSFTETTCTVYNYSNLADTALSGASTSLSVTTVGHTGCTVWVDFNNNGIFDSSENLYYSYNGTSTPEVYNFSITIPSGLVSGAYRMRILDAWESNGYTSDQTNGYGPCTTYNAAGGGGNFDDFTLYVKNPALTTSVPFLSGFSADACGVSSVQSFTISAQNLLAGGSVTVTAPAGYQVSQSGFGYGSATTILYAGSSLSSTIFVRFLPASGGPISGNITFSGGGIVTAPTVTVSGVANGLYVNAGTLPFGNVTEYFSAVLVDTLKGVNLASPDNVTISVSPSTPDFQISSDSSSWGSSCVIPVSGATLNAPVYTRLTPGALGAEAPATISFAYSGSACTPSVTATGTGTPACTTPAAPANMTYTNVTNSGVTINITPAGTPDGYLVLQSITPFSAVPVNGTTYTVGNTIANGTITSISATQPFTITGLAANTTYYYTVIPYNGGAASACGGGPLYGSYITSPATTCIGSPASPFVSNITSGGFTANWTAPSSGGGAYTVTYSVNVATDNAFANPVAGSPFTSGSVTSLIIGGLNPTATYYYNVVANAACSSAPTATGTATTTAYTYATVPITSGFTFDVVAEGTQAPSVSTTANDGTGGGFDGGSFSYLSLNYNYNGNLPLNGGTYGLPVNGSFTSTATPGLPYQLAPYTSNNALIITGVSGDLVGGVTGINTGTLFFTPVYANTFYILGNNGGGGSTGTTVSVTTTFTDNSTQTSSLIYGDWYNNTGSTLPDVLPHVGRVVVSTGVTNGTSAGPNLYEGQFVVSAANATKQVKSLTFSANTGNNNGYVGIYGVSMRSGTLVSYVSSLPLFTGLCAPAQFFTISGSSLFPTGGSIGANAPTGFQVSADGNTWGTIATFSYAVNTLGNSTVYVRPDPSYNSAASGNITFTGGTANNPPVIAVSGTGTGLAVKYASVLFGNVVQGATSATQIDSASGTGLTAGTITLTSSNIDFQISTDNVNFSYTATINNTGATLAETPVYIRLIPFLIAPDTSTISISGAGAPCAATIVASGTGVPCVTGTWLGATSNDWGTASNWSCSTVPTTATAVTIAANAPNMPSIGSGTYTVSTLSLSPNTTLAIAAGATLNVTGAIADTGTISGAGVVALNGTSGTQNLTGNGYISNLTVNNSATIISPDTMKITGSLMLASGTLTTNGGLVLVSNAAGTARIAAITPGSIISGTVKVQQYIPGGNRAFRFLGHPFNAAISLSQLEANIDVTGQGGTNNGFTQTNSNNPSVFWYNPVTGNGSAVNDSTGWIPFTNANGAALNGWKQYEGIRILVRGMPTQGLDGNSYTPLPVTLNMSGNVNTGTQTETMLVGDTSGYNLLSNPYPSPTDIGTVIGNAGANISGSIFWVWNDNIGAHGAYAPIPISNGAYYSQCNASFVVNAAVNNSTLTFAESNKGATANTALFKATNMNNGVTLHLYDSIMHPWDVVYVSFNSNASNNIENHDGRHLHNANLDFYSLSADNQQLSLDARPYVTGQVIPLGIATDVQQTYIIKAEDFALTPGEDVYLHDKYLNQYQQLQDGSQYTFSITADPASQGNNRFELSMTGNATGVANVNGSNGLKVSMVPNPATEQVTISYEAPRSEKTSVRIMNMAGQEVVNMELGDEQKGSVTIPLHNVAAGMYVVELISGSQMITQRLVKQ